jgi:hypothetical protein
MTSERLSLSPNVPGTAVANRVEFHHAFRKIRPRFSLLRSRRGVMTQCALSVAVIISVGVSELG